jgi:hypothetical protein
MPTISEELFEAVQSKSKDLMDHAAASIVHGGPFVNAVNAHGTPILVLAAKKNFAHGLSVLVHKGAALNARDQEGATALIWAAHMGWAEGVELLLEFGASPFSKDACNYPPRDALGYATKAGSVDCCALIELAMEAENPSRFKKVRQDLDRPLRDSYFRNEVASRKAAAGPAFEARRFKRALEAATRKPTNQEPERMRL